MQNFTVKVQSFSDIITNSSSEIFCTISSNEASAIKEIFDSLFRYNDDSEMGPTVEYNSEDNTVDIWLPYDMYSVQEFFKFGIEAVLNNKFKNKYNIKYND